MLRPYCLRLMAVTEAGSAKPSALRMVPIGLQVGVQPNYVDCLRFRCSRCLCDVNFPEALHFAAGLCSVGYF